jgi:flagellar motor switch protein FliM
MTPAFSPVMTLTLGATSHLASAMFLQGPNPAEGCLLVAMSVLLGEDGPYEASLCLPFSLLLPILDALERMDRMDHPDEDDVVNRQLRSRLLATACDLSVCFPEIRLTPDELLTLAPGDVIRLHRPEGLPLLLNAGGMTVAPVVITQRGRRLACMVVDPESEEVFHE